MHLNQNRKADREIIAQRVEEIATAHGATVARVISPLPGRVIAIDITAAHDLCCRIEIKPGAGFLLPWNIRSGNSDVRLHPSFGRVNEYHGQKATHFANSLEDLFRMLRQNLAMAQSGEAFILPEPQALSYPSDLTQYEQGARVVCGPFVFELRDSGDCECWSLCNLPKGVSRFSLKNYGPGASTSFSGWRVVSGGPFGDKYETRAEAFAKGVPWLIAYYTKQVEEKLEEALALRNALFAFSNSISPKVLS